MEPYQHFCHFIDKEVMNIRKISELDLNDRRLAIGQAMSAYSKILGFYNSDMFSSQRQNMDSTTRKRLLNNQDRLSSVITHDTSKQYPYVDEFIGAFNFYHGFIIGQLISMTIKEQTIKIVDS